MELSVRVTGPPNAVPVVTSLPLSPTSITHLLHSPSWPSLPFLLHTPGTLCSTLNLHSGHSLLDLQLLAHNASSSTQLDLGPLYLHLNRSRCEWVFRRWYSVGSLVEECGGQWLNVSTEWGPVLLTTHTTYLHFSSAEMRLSVTPNQTTTTVSTEGLSPPQPPPPPPLHILPDISPSPSSSSSPSSYLYPLSISSVGSDGVTEVILHVVTPANTLLFPKEEQNDNLQLLFSSMSGTSHVCSLRLHHLGPVVVGFRGQSTAGSNCVECEGDYAFRMNLGEGGEGGRPGLLLEIVATLQDDQFTIGEFPSYMMCTGCDALSLSLLQEIG